MTLKQAFDCNEDEYPEWVPEVLKAVRGRKTVAHSDSN